MVRLAECKGTNLITSRLSYDSTAIELISVPIGFPNFDKSY